MAKFELAIPKILKTEAGYVNDPDDAGGETFAGIARKFNQMWQGWFIIEGYKNKCKLPSEINKLNKLLFADKELMNLVHSIYKRNYWDPIYLDNIKNQKVAEQIFDTAVNMGVGVAIKFCAETLGLPITTKMNEEILYKLKQL